MNRPTMREVRPLDKLSARLSELQQGVRASAVVGGRGINVTQTPDGVIVEAAQQFDDGSTAADSTTIIPRWG